MSTSLCDYLQKRNVGINKILNQCNPFSIICFKYRQESLIPIMLSISHRVKSLVVIGIERWLNTFGLFWVLCWIVRGNPPTAKNARSFSLLNLHHICQL